MNGDISSERVTPGMAAALLASGKIIRVLPLDRDNFTVELDGGINLHVTAEGEGPLVFEVEYEDDNRLVEFANNSSGKETQP